MKISPTTNGNDTDPSIDSQGGSGINDIGNLIHMHRLKYHRGKPNDKQWPCPFCFTESKTKIQCIIHIKKDHPNIYGADKKLLADFAHLDESKNQTDESTSKANESILQNLNWKKCTFCPPELSQKFFAGDRSEDSLFQETQGHRHIHGQCFINTRRITVFQINPA